MHPDDARMELAVATIKKTLRDIDFALLANDKNAGANSTAVMMPAAYAMFETLVRDIDGNPDHWHQFLREALNETILIHG